MNTIAVLDYLKSNTKAKIAIYATLAVLLAAVVIYLVLKTKGVSSKIADTEANQKLVDDLNSEIASDQITLTQAQFNSYASTLYMAMKGPGTAENKIYEVFRNLSSRSDVLQLIKTFGIKNGESLNDWLNEDLSANEVDKINQILSGNGINYKF